MRPPSILMALQEEAGDHFSGLPVHFSGVGKLNAAYRLMKLLHEHQPEHVVNLGTAGSAHFDSGVLINCTQFVQRDMDATPLGFAPFQTPFDDHGHPVLDYGERLTHLPQGTCGTGDSFHTEGAVEHFNLVDMEAYVLARICRQEGVRFTCVKYITDGANGAAANDWRSAVEQGAVKLREVYDQVRA